MIALEKKLKIPDVFGNRTPVLPITLNASVVTTEQRVTMDIDACIYVQRLANALSGCETWENRITSMLLNRSNRNDRKLYHASFN